MTAQSLVEPGIDQFSDPHAWIGLVLDHFARGEQAIGRLCVALDLSIANGSLGSLKQLRERLCASNDRRANALEKRIARWSENRPFRHLLAHATIMELQDDKGARLLVTRHLPRDRDDVTPDRLWTCEDQRELLRQASNDGRSISDTVRNILLDPALVAKLRSP